MLRLAIADPAGAERAFAYTEKLGPLSRDVDVRQKVDGHADQLFRDPTARHPRFAASGATYRTTVSRDSLSLGSRKRGASGRSLWIGEARRLRVEKAETVYDAIGDMFGAGMRRLAEKRGVTAGALPAIAPPAEDDLAQRLRDLLRARDAVGAARATLHVSPDAWVLSAPLASAAPRIESLIEVAAEVSAHLD